MREKALTGTLVVPHYGLGYCGGPLAHCDGYSGGPSFVFGFSELA